MKHGVLQHQLDVAREIAADEEITTDWTKLVGRDTEGNVTSLIVIAKGETAAEFLENVDDFESRRA